VCIYSSKAIASLLLCAAGAKVTDTIRKGIIDIEPYENATAVLMVGNVAALTGNAVYYESCSGTTFIFLLEFRYFSGQT